MRSLFIFISFFFAQIVGPIRPLSPEPATQSKVYQKGRSSNFALSRTIWPVWVSQVNQLPPSKYNIQQVSQPRSSLTLANTRVCFTFGRDLLILFCSSFPAPPKIGHDVPREVIAKVDEPFKIHIPYTGSPPDKVAVSKVSSCCS